MCGGGAPSVRCPCMVTPGKMGRVDEGHAQDGRTYASSRDPSSRAASTGSSVGVVAAYRVLPSGPATRQLRVRWLVETRSRIAPPGPTRTHSPRSALATHAVPSRPGAMPSGAMGLAERAAIAGWSRRAETRRVTRPSSPGWLRDLHRADGMSGAQGRGGPRRPSGRTGSRGEAHRQGLRDQQGGPLRRTLLVVEQEQAVREHQRLAQAQQFTLGGETGEGCPGRSRRGVEHRVGLPADEAVVVEAEVAHVGAAQPVDEHVVDGPAGDVLEVGVHDQGAVRLPPVHTVPVHRDDQHPPVGQPAQAPGPARDLQPPSPVPPGCPSGAPSRGRGRRTTGRRRASATTPGRRIRPERLWPSVAPLPPEAAERSW